MSARWQWRSRLKCSTVWGRSIVWVLVACAVATYVGVGSVDVKKYMTVPAKPSAPRASAMTGARLGADSLMVV